MAKIKVKEGTVILPTRVSPEMLTRLDRAVMRDRKRIHDRWTRSDAIREALTMYLAERDAL